MGIPVTDSTGPRSMPPRFSTGRISGGLIACAWFCASVGALMSAPTPVSSALLAPHQGMVDRAGDGSPGFPAASQMPPAGTGLDASVGINPDPARNALPVARVLAKRRSHSTPSPSATPQESPAASDGSSTPSPAAASGGDAASATPAPEATPNGTPSPAFMQKFEAATVQFIQKDFVGAKKLLDEADAIQPHQPNSVSLRNQIFKQYYETAYAAYQHADYPAALTQLDGADSVGSNSQNQSDAFNLRGLVLSKQRNYTEAETMFRKAVQTDPGLWAAKFNYAEVPFNYRNYTLARSRFEELFSQTDAAKQPVEAELTQFKVFLTLLLEGKEDAARTFMQHFNFSGATPARYFCQAALNFYGGDVDKAQGWIDSARKEYPPRKSSSFLEAFYRVGWLTDPNATPGASGTALAAASPPVPPTSTPAASPTVTEASAATPTPTPGKVPSTALAASSPGAAKAPSVPPLAVLPTPALAAASPAATPVFRTAVPPPAPPAATPAVVASTPVPTASKAPVLAVVTPTPAPSKAPVLAVVTPTPAPSKAPALAVSTPTPAPSKPPVAVVSTPVPTASRAPAVVLTTPPPSPAKAPALAAASPAARATASVNPTLAKATPAVRTAAALPPPTAAPVAKTTAEAAQPASGGSDFVRSLVVGLVALYFVYVVARILWSAINRKPKQSAGGGASSYGSRERTEADKVETPR